MVTTQNRAPGVQWQGVVPTPVPPFLTGVPAFLGYPGSPVDHHLGPRPEPRLLTLWPQFDQHFGPRPERGHLAPAVQGFFENDGLLCYVVGLDASLTRADALRQGLDDLRSLDDVDLVCAPDIMNTPDAAIPPEPDEVAALQRIVLDHCEARGDRFAILDSVGTEIDGPGLRSSHGALYHPWVLTRAPGGEHGYVPPCGHVAGTYSRTDRQVGTHRAPANVELEGVLDLRIDLGEAEVGRLNEQGVNCLRALPGRGVRVWGARTLADPARDPEWRHVNVRRVLLTLGRWLERFMTSLVYEPNDVRLWVRIMRDLSAHLEGLYQRGALKGSTPEEAFFVKCDAETNPADVVDSGSVVTHIGVAPAQPAEFVVVRVIHGASGVAITTAE